eukprot:5012559-Prymnesium_polylepis.1
MVTYRPVLCASARGTAIVWCAVACVRAACRSACGCAPRRGRETQNHAVSNATSVCPPGPRAGGRARAHVSTCAHACHVRCGLAAVWLSFVRSPKRDGRGRGLARFNCTAPVDSSTLHRTPRVHLCTRVRCAGSDAPVLWRPEAWSPALRVPAILETHGSTPLLETAPSVEDGEKNSRPRSCSGRRSAAAAQENSLSAITMASAITRWWNASSSPARLTALSNLR